MVVKYFRGAECDIKHCLIVAEDRKARSVHKHCLMFAEVRGTVSAKTVNTKTCGAIQYEEDN
jgi:hypothetical protein